MPISIDSIIIIDRTVKSVFLFICVFISFSFLESLQGGGLSPTALIGETIVSVQ